MPITPFPAPEPVDPALRALTTFRNTLAVGHGPDEAMAEAIEPLLHRIERLEGEVAERDLRAQNASAALAA